MKPQGLYRQQQCHTEFDINKQKLTDKQNIALSNGDVLTDFPNDPVAESKQNPKFSAWRL